jgi:hypothetical protein
VNLNPEGGKRDQVDEGEQPNEQPANEEEGRRGLSHSPREQSVVVDLIVEGGADSVAGSATAIAIVAIDVVARRVSNTKR